MIAPPCPHCGRPYPNRHALNRHLHAAHPSLSDRERSDTVHEWMAQAGERP